jgi:DNA polymerase-3 subunit beta
MEITVKRDDIYSGLLKTQSIVEKRSTMPILSNVFLEAKGDKVRIRATDLEIGVDTTYPADVAREGSLTVPGKKLFEMVREMEAGELRLMKKGNNQLEIRSGKAVFSILGLPSEDFPSFPSYEDKVFFKLQAKAISRMIEKTIYAVSTDEIRYTLNGVFLERTDDKLRMVATDGHRLSLIDLSDPSIKDMEMGKGVIIPRKGASELKRILEDGKEDLMVSIKEDSGVFKIGNTVLVMRMIEGEFPDYRQVIPKKGDKEAVVNRELLSRALRRVSILSSEKSRGVKLSFSKGQVEVSTANPEVGEASESIEAEFTGGDIGIGFNAKYMIDILNSIDEGDVRIEMKDELGPVQVRGLDGEEYLSIIMPMRM